MSEYIPNMNSKELSDECERAMKKGYWDKKLFPELIKRLAELERLRKKEVAMKVNGYTNDWGCKVCDSTIEFEYPRCPYCGQKLDWSE